MFRIPNAPWITSNHHYGSMHCAHCGDEWNHTRHPTPETFLRQLRDFGLAHRNCPKPTHAAVATVGA